MTVGLLPQTEDLQEALQDLAALPKRHPDRSAARDQVIVAWLPLAQELARRFAGRGEPVQDLEQTATVGLIKAVDRFDIRRGSDFAAFAVPTILGEVKRYFRDQTWDLHVPRRLQELRRAIAESTETLAQRLGHAPSPSEVASDLHLPEDEVREGMRAARAYAIASLDAPVGGATGAAGPTLGDLLGGEDADLARADLRLAVAPAIAALPARDQRILHLRFVGNLTQEQIAAQVGVSQMHVSRLLTRILQVLRAHLTDPAERPAPVSAAGRRVRGKA